jgi:hypothetical protein
LERTPSFPALPTAKPACDVKGIFVAAHEERELTAISLEEAAEVLRDRLP